MKRVCCVCGFHVEGMSGWSEINRLTGRVVLMCRRCWELPFIFAPNKKMHPKYISRVWPNHELSEFVGAVR